MTLDVEQRAAARRRRLTLTIATVLGAVLLVIVAATAVVRATGDDPPSPEPSPTPSASTPGQAGTGPYVPAERWAQLPRGAAQVEEYPVRFPHTAAGAAAAAAASVRYSTTLDYETAIKVQRLYTARPFAAQADAAAQTTVGEARRRVGAPEQGQVPDSSSVTATPIGVQWQMRSKDEVVVLMLSRVQFASANETKSSVIASSGVMIWVPGPGPAPGGGDWKIKPAPPEDLPEPAELGTPEFNRYRWMAIDQEHQ